jgi:SulP family sulfate permease
LQEINRTLQARQVRRHLSEVKGPVMDRLQRSELLCGQLSEQVFLSPAEAFRALGEAGEKGPP